ncbi:apovitellenin-1-like [Leptodactylus fuscus]|uniref:apovitellenin-1-like n=1 Tax=Leptodactylus fuscus TaxID=238119 RepID=UPI003F4EDECE
MRVHVLAAACLLLFVSYGVEGKSVSKRHVRRDWLILPDTIAYYIYTTVNEISPEAAKKLMDMFENPRVQEIRSFLIAKTSELSRITDDLYQKITDYFQ